MARSQTTPLPAVPLRTPMHVQPQGSGAPVLSRTWSTFFEQLVGAIGGVGGPSDLASGASEYLVPVVGGFATPDASKGTNILILTADTQVTAPLNPGASSGIDIPWSLIVQQDPAGGSGGWSTIFDASYYMTVAIASVNSPTNTQCHVDFKTKPSGNTYIAGAPSIDQPIAT